MKIDILQQGAAPQEKNLRGDLRNDANRHEWLKEMERAQSDAMKKMHSVIAPGIDHENSGLGQITAVSSLPLNLSHPSHMADAKNIQVATASSMMRLTLPNEVTEEKAQPAITPAAKGISAGLSSIQTMNEPAEEAQNVRPLSKVNDESNRTIWNAENVHMEITEEGAVVWIRNAQIDMRDQRELVSRFRRDLLQHGIRMQTIYVNGKQMSESAKSHLPQAGDGI